MLYENYYSNLKTFRTFCFETKTCIKCKRSYPATEEYFSLTNFKNLSNICITCFKTYTNRKAVTFRHNLILRDYKPLNQHETIDLVNRLLYQNKKTFEGSLSCEYCKTNLDYTNYSIDHRTPISKEGSPNDITNLAICCVPCQRAKIHFTESEFLKQLNNFIIQKRKIETIKIKVCRICHKPLPRTNAYFGKYTRAPDGLNNQCKNCVNRQYKLNRKPINKRKSYLWFLRRNLETSEFKLCRICLKLLPRKTEYFGYLSRNNDRLRNQCKKCKRIEDNKYNKKKQLIKQDNSIKENYLLTSFIKKINLKN